MLSLYLKGEKKGKKDSMLKPIFFRPQLYSDISKISGKQHMTTYKNT